MPQSFRMSIALVAVIGVALAAFAADFGTAPERDTSCPGPQRVADLARQLEGAALAAAQRTGLPRDGAVVSMLREISASHGAIAESAIPLMAAVTDPDASAPSPGGATVVNNDATNAPAQPAVDQLEQSAEKAGSPAASGTEGAEKATPPESEVKPSSQADTTGEALTPPAPRQEPAPSTAEANASLASHIRSILRDMKGGTDTIGVSGVSSGTAPAKAVAEDLSKMAAPPVVSKEEPKPATATAPAVEAQAATAEKPEKSPESVKQQDSPKTLASEKSKPANNGSPTSSDGNMEQIVNIDFRDMELTNVVALLAHKADINVIAGADLRGTVTANLRNVTLRQAMETCLRMNSLGLLEEEGIFRIVPYDEAVTAQMRTEMIVLKNANAADVEKVVNDVVKSSPDRQNISVSTSKTANLLVVSAPKARIGELLNLVQTLDIAEPSLPVVTESIALNYASPQDVAKMLQKMLTPKLGQVAADDRARLVVLTDMPVVVEQMKLVVKSVDTPVNQVMIEVMVVDAILSDSADTGVKWLMSAVKRFSQTGQPIGSLQSAELATDLTALKTAAGLLNFSILTDKIDWQGMIQMEVTNRNASLVSNPVVMTVENQPANITIAQEIPYTDLSQTSAGGSQTSTKFKEVGTILDVTPKVTHDKHIICKVEGKESVTAGEFQGVPIEDKRQISSTMSLSNGQTVFIGGLRKNKASSGARKVPVLGDIPIANILFRTNSRSEDVNELMVFLTCNVIEEGQTLTERQEQIKEDATTREAPRVDAFETVLYDTVHPQDVKTEQIKWRRGK